MRDKAVSASPTVSVLGVLVGGAESFLELVFKEAGDFQRQHRHEDMTSGAPCVTIDVASFGKPLCELGA